LSVGDWYHHYRKATRIYWRKPGILYEIQAALHAMDNNLASYAMMKYYRFIFLLSKNDDGPQSRLSNPCMVLHLSSLAMLYDLLLSNSWTPEEEAEAYKSEETYMQMTKLYSYVARSVRMQKNLSGAMPSNTELHKNQLVLVHMQSPVSYL